MQSSPKKVVQKIFIIFHKNKFVANFIGDANVIKAEILNKQSNYYDLKIAEMKIKIHSDKEF